jgi:hypothetical protein
MRGRHVLTDPSNQTEMALPKLDKQCTDKQCTNMT